jgi:hypothetical protein
LRPLTEASLSSFAAVTEFIKAAGSIQKDDAMQKVRDSFD